MINRLQKVCVGLGKVGMWLEELFCSFLASQEMGIVHLYYYFVVPSLVNKEYPGNNNEHYFWHN